MHELNCTVSYGSFMTIVYSGHCTASMCMHKTAMHLDPYYSHSRSSSSKWQNSMHQTTLYTATSLLYPVFLTDSTVTVCSLWIKLYDYRVPCRWIEEIDQDAQLLFIQPPLYYYSHCFLAHCDHYRQIPLLQYNNIIIVLG